MQADAEEFNPASTAAMRQTMVDCQVRTFDVTDQRLLAAMLAVPRENFVPASMRALAYSDVGITVPFATGEAQGRYLLTPMILARMIQGARVIATDRCLDLAPGTGYSTAVLAQLCSSVVALEDTTEARRAAEETLSKNGLGGVQVIERALQQGVAEASPFDVILVNGSAEVEPEALFSQLADGGRLVVIMRNEVDPTGRASKAVCFEKRNGAMGRRYLFDASAPVLPAFAKRREFVF